MSGQSNLQSRLNGLPIVTIILIALNVAIYVIVPFLPDQQAISNSMELSAYALMRGEWWTMITSMFAHSGLAHIACNMVSLYYLGTMCENVFGRVKYLILYFISGIAGGLAFVAVEYASGNIFASAVGASGAIFGLFGAYGYLLIREHSDNKVFAYKPGKSDFYWYGCILVANLLIGFAPGSNIANEAHIGGMVCGFIVGAVMYGILTFRGGKPARVL